jgi:hypothetical protein
VAKVDQIKTGYPQQVANLPMGRNNLKRFLAPYATRDFVRVFDDFTDLSLNTGRWAVANSGGAGAANFATNTQAGGAVRGATGTTANGSQSLVGPVIFTPSKNIMFEIQFKYDVVTGLNFEVGLIDAVPGANGSGVSDIDTPAVTMANGAASAATTTTTVPTAATYMTVRIETRGAYAKCWVNGVEEATLAGPTAGTLLAPWVYSRTRNTTTHLMDIDYIHVWCER